MGNLDGFDPDRDRVDPSELTELDLWAYEKLDALNDKIRAAYDALDYHIAFHAIHNFCVVDMSSFYLDILKDRLYCEKADSVLRKAAQTAMYDILSSLTLFVAPILSFTAEEIWKFLPKSEKFDGQSVFLNEMPAKFSLPLPEGFDAKWDTIAAVRLDVQKALENKRAAKIIGKSLEAEVTLFCDGGLYDQLSAFSGELAEIFIVSKVKVCQKGSGEFTGETEGLSIDVKHAEGEKCERCWAYLDTVGSDPEHPTLCARCAAAVK